MSKLIFNPLAASIISLLAIIFWFSLYQTTQEIRSSGQDTKIIRDNIDDLTLEIQNLEGKISLAKDPNTREQMVRNELLMQKEGEYVLKLPDIETIETKPEEIENLTVWQEWQELLF